MARPLRSSRAAWKTRRLARAARGLASAGEGRVDLLCRLVLAAHQGGEDVFAGDSRLNNDGGPLQLCLSASSKGRSLRLIGDPGAFLDGTEARYRCAVEALRAALESSGSTALTAEAERTLELLIPASAEGRSRYRDGFLWLAVSPERPGIALYVEAAPLGQAGGWQAAAEWLSDLLPEADRALARLRPLADRCAVASLSLEGSTPADARAKVYFRLAHPMALRELGTDLLCGDDMGRFFGLALADRGVDLDGFVLCMGFSLASGDLTDVKADLCGHCLAFSDGEWIDLVERCGREFGLWQLPVREALETGDCEVALLGFGIGRDREARLNLYLKGRDRLDLPSREETEAALRDAALYLVGLQDESGRWTDYRLPVGASDQWVTAYVGLALAQCGRWAGQREALAAACRGAGWLTRERTYAEGWGYNGSTGPDADSTAMGLALLRELGRVAPPADRAFLRRHWRPEGGLATFSGPAAWGCAHWDVTPWGYLVLGAEDQAALRESFLSGLRRNRMPDGFWRAYWWRNPFYSTFVTLEVLRELGLPEPDLPVVVPAAPRAVDNAFDLACLIAVELFRGASRERTGRRVRTLLQWQAANGSWPGHANLRVTDNSCYAPWEEPAGDCFADEAATITTATAVRVLTHLLEAS